MFIEHPIQLMDPNTMVEWIWESPRSECAEEEMIKTADASAEDNRCIDCAKTFSSKVILSPHERCINKWNEMKAALIFHLRNHKRNSHKCDECGKGFPSVKRLESHKCGWGQRVKEAKEAKEAKTNQDLVCPSCHKVCFIRFNLFLHQSQIESEMFPRVWRGWWM